MVYSILNFHTPAISAYYDLTDKIPLGQYIACTLICIYLGCWASSDI